MWLLTRGENGEIALTEDRVGQIPDYAILSHTWGPNADEVTFADMREGTGRGKKGYGKIEFCAKQAARDGLHYFWVDTCCIDKSNKAELDEAINSMFQWYRNAARCYAYLTDVSTNPAQNNPPGTPWEQALLASRWFTRGWTLQELLAPASVAFFSQEHVRLGDKASLQRQIHKITRIPISALQTSSLSSFSLEERFSWAERRETTRPEDRAYCLLGIFGVFIPLIYGEGTENAMRRLKREIDETQKRQVWLRKLYTCPYRDRKDRNPPRVEGTCRWFTSHPLFQHWQQSKEASLLWVSADPGCGKSVLARHLADDILCGTDARTTCYFFFKEDFEDQRSSVIALCALLHQLFTQSPALFSDQILKMFESKGDKLLSSFGDLWDILVSAATGDPTREIVCILDALDECTGSERDQLIHAIRRFYSNTSVRTPTLKFLLTSRPYLDIKVGFQELTGRTPTIHLSGENEEEADKICREIDLVVDSRIAKMDRLAEKERAVLRKEMAGVTNRTYLWVHLVLEEVGKAILLSPTKIRSAVRNIPRTVDEAYERILSKSRDAQLAKKLLHIIVAAARPLTLREMSVALALDHTHRSFSDLELPPEARFREDVRELCGQFVVVLDSKIYLLHQTAREFLVHPPSLSIPPGSTTLRWKFALHPRESNRILSEICVLRLSLPGSSLQDRRKKRGWEDYAAEPTLFEYAAKFWDDHFRGSDWEASDTMMMKEVVSLFDPNLPAYSKWFTRYQGFPPLMAASYLGLGVVVQAMLAQPGADPNARDETGSTALHWALDHYDEILVRHLLDAAADSNMRDKNSMTPLHYACKQGSVAVVQALLAHNADVKVRNSNSMTPLHYACKQGSVAVVQALWAYKADLNVRDDYGRTPLHYACEQGNGAVVQALLSRNLEIDPRDDRTETESHCYACPDGMVAPSEKLVRAGADANAVDARGSTPLHLACERFSLDVVRQLVGGGADVNARNQLGLTPLYWAASYGRAEIVQQLLDAGADTIVRSERDLTPYSWGPRSPYHAMVWQHSVSSRGQTGHKPSDCWLLQQLLEIKSSPVPDMPLFRAVHSGHGDKLRLVLSLGIDVNETDSLGETALHEASRRGYDTGVRQLLAAGADANAKGQDGWTPLHNACDGGRNTVVAQLLAAGADANVKGQAGRTPLHHACYGGHNTVVEQLLAAGADVNAKDCSMFGYTPLHFASALGHEAIVRRLLEAGTDTNTRNALGKTPLDLASEHGHATVSQLLLEHGARKGDTMGC